MDIEMDLVATTEDTKKNLTGGVKPCVTHDNWFKAVEHTPVVGEYVWVYSKEYGLLAAIQWRQEDEDTADKEGVLWHPVDAPKLPEFDEFYSK